jgi:thiol-disulfide isomerase/thioredoxin
MVMNKTMWITLCCVLFVFSIHAQEKTLEVGAEAPTFSLPTLDQKYIYLRDYCGAELRKPWKNKIKHVVVLSFFATWCKPCLEEIPHLEKIQERFKNQPVKFYLINVGEERERINEFLKKREINLTILLDRYKKTAEKYGALILPRLIVVDKEGLVKKKQTGFKDGDEFEKELRTLIEDLLR